MTARPLLEWSDGAAGPVLRLTPVADPRKVTWRDFALCAEADPEAWFPDTGEPSAPAKAICAACFVRGQCLDYALATDQAWGVWGGLSECQRRKLKKEMAAA